MKLTLIDNLGRQVTQPASFPAAGAPAGAQYVVLALDSGLSAEFSLGSLAAGLLKNNPGSNPSIAVNADLPLMGAAASGAAGERGAVPQPTAGQEGYFLRGDAQWANVADAWQPLVPATSLASNAANIDLQPAGMNKYSQLIITLALRSDRAAVGDGCIIRFNNDATPANYNSDSSYIQNGTTLAGASFRGVTKTGGFMTQAATGNTGLAAMRSLLKITLFDYNSASKPRSYFYQGICQQDNANMYTISGGGTWLNTAAAISRITLLPDVGTNWLAGCRYSMLAQ